MGGKRYFVLHDYSFHKRINACRAFKIICVTEKDEKTFNYDTVRKVILKTIIRFFLLFFYSGRIFVENFSDINRS